ncbi:MAG: hypothetical protein EOP45_08805 [Sphingobacteriaceae bacterium]|nr:MAG: hypothetical protein EOP45_08805 [Sphingobacteriaceae bacterium]
MSSTMISTDFASIAQFTPTGQWNLPANVATTVPHSLWANTGNSDQNAADLTDNAIMNSSGILICPYTGRFDISSIICGADWGFKGTMTISMIYSPVNSASTSPKYTLATCQITPTKNTVTMEQRVYANSGDTITLTFSPTTAINAPTMAGPTTGLIFTDVTTDINQTFFYSVAGAPPTLASLNKSCLMQTALVTNGIATLTLCQDGTNNGCSLFQQIVGISIVPQAPNTITGPLGVATFSVDPFVVGQKTITVHLSVNGALPGAGWSIIASMWGY